MNATGQYLIVGAISGRFWTSSDYGATWIERRPKGNIDANWTPVASSADGSHLIVGDYGGSLWTSSDYGVTWMEQKPAGGYGFWKSVASDFSGSHLIVGGDLPGGRLYTWSD